MELRFKLTSKVETAAGVNLRLIPVEGAEENEEFISAPSAEIVLDCVNPDACKEMRVPRTIVTPGPKESEVRTLEFPYQEYLVTIEKA